MLGGRFDRYRYSMKRRTMFGGKIIMPEKNKNKRKECAKAWNQAGTRKESQVHEPSVPPKSQKLCFSY